MGIPVGAAPILLIRPLRSRVLGVRDVGEAASLREVLLFV